MLVPGLAGAPCEGPRFAGPVATRMFDDLVRAQVELSSTAKTDPAWTKRR
jgi:hypothetical protein